MDNVLDRLLERLRKAFGERLVSVVLYGSAVAGDRHEGFSDYNVLCILSEITARELADAADTFRWWRELGNPAPLLLTGREAARSADCFAIEFRDIQWQHRLLHGRDVIGSLPIDDIFYRAQVEHDLRAKFLRLRQKAAGMMADPNLLRRLLLDSVSTFCVLFRHALALHGAPVPAPAQKRDVLRLAAERFGIDPTPFETLLDIRQRRRKPGAMEPVSLLAAYLEQIARVIDAVDALARSGGV